MIQTSDSSHAFLHNKNDRWLYTPDNAPLGYIQPHELKELWFHAGTICNLSCPFCLEGSKPGDNRLNQISLSDIKPFVREALTLGVERFSFTGGEPFVVKEMADILDYALDYKPCLVLTNATKPLNARLDQIKSLKEKPNNLSFRVSIDYPDPVKHDSSRGEGNFLLAFETIGKLFHLGFNVSIARQIESGEDSNRVDQAYHKYFKQVGIPVKTKIVKFPDFLRPGSIANVPHITEDCMVRYHSQESRNKFMCSFSKMIVKKNGLMRVYACTLVDDDTDYDLGPKITESMKIRIMMKHHRCYSCFAQGASCSEI